jgi:hypothetical protein
MKFQNIFEQIKSNSIEEHEKILEDRILEIQLQYVDKLFSKKIAPLNKDVNIGNIKELVSEYTDIPRKIMEYRDGDSNQSELLSLKNKILDAISVLYEKDHEHWIEKTEKMVNEELKGYSKKENQNDDNKLENKAGLISFDMGSGFDHVFPGSDIRDEDVCLNIHFEAFYKQESKDKKKFSKNSLEESLEELALKIVDEHPETKVIVGESWLMSTPIAKIIGFTIYNKKLPFANGPFWGQFIDKNGQIKKEEISNFLETGEPPYQIALGAIKVEDFLKTYLPNERKGEIILKELTKEALDFSKDFNRVSNELEDKFDVFSFDEIVDLMNSNTILANYFKTEDGKEYMGLIKKVKELNIKRSEVKFLQYKNMDEIKNKFNKYVDENRNKYTERKVLI